MEFLILLIPLIGGLFSLMNLTEQQEKVKTLQRNFQKLGGEDGSIKGKTYDEIVNLCGKPNAMSPVGNGRTLYQWMAQGYHISLLFDANDICLGVTQVTSV